MNIRKAALNFSDKGLTEFPKEVFETKKLYKLNLSHNQIKDIPKEINQLKYLETLDLSYNRIRNLYAKLFELPNLKIINLNNNEIIRLPKQIQKLKKLKTLMLMNNKLNVVPYELAQLEYLEELNLSGNNLGFLPIEIEPFRSLKALWLAGNPLRELTAEDILNNFPKLKALYCYSADMENRIRSRDQRIWSVSLSKGNGLPFLKDLVKQVITPTDDLKNLDKPKMTEVEKIRKAGIPKIFISYAHSNFTHLVNVKRHLKAMSYEFEYEVWDDTKIHSSEKWKETIAKELNDASIAILLVSTDFLGSDFIRSNELPQLLEAAEKKGTHIHPVIVEPCRFSKSPLYDWQAVNPPSKAISECSPPEQDRYWLKLCADIEKNLSL